MRSDVGVVVGVVLRVQCKADVECIHLACVVAVRCSVLQCVTVCGSVLQCVAVYFSVLSKYILV